MATQNPPTPNQCSCVPIGWETQKWQLSFQIDDVEYFQLEFNSEVISKDCCTWTEYENIFFADNVYDSFPEIFEVSLNL